jgi:hemolysin activation/secretion protein
MMSNFAFKKTHQPIKDLLFLWMVGLTLCFTFPVSADEISSTTDPFQPSVLPPPPVSSEPAPPLTPPERTLDQATEPIPDPKEELLTVEKIDVKQIAIVGNTVLTEKHLSMITRPFIGRTLTLPQLHEIPGAITKAYIKEGFLLTKAYLPQQTVIEGLITVYVLNGTIGEIVVKGHQRHSERFIKKPLEKAVRAEVHPRLNRLLERPMLILNDTPNVGVSATLQAGTATGTTDILLQVKEDRRSHLMIDYNNFGSQSVSRDRWGTEFKISDLQFEGSELSVRLVSGHKPEQMLYGRILYALPLNSNGTRLSLSHTAGDIDLAQQFAAAGIKTQFENSSLSVTHPFIKRRLLVFEGEAGLDAGDFRQSSEVSAGVLIHDVLRKVRVEIRLNQTQLQGRNFLSLSLSQGLGEAFGGMDNSSALSSRQAAGADNRFTTLNLDLTHLHQFTPTYGLRIRTAAQTTHRPLVSGEQYSLGGADSVRGYQMGELLGDNGYNAIAELHVAPFSNKERTQFIFFVDHGGVQVKKPTPNSDALTGYGVGVRYTLRANLPIRIDMGIPLSDTLLEERTNPVWYIQAAWYIF